MLRVEDARELAAKWRPRFVDQANFDASWHRAIERIGNPSIDRVEQWLAEDQQKDAVLFAGLQRPDGPDYVPTEVSLRGCANRLCRRPCPDEFCCIRCVRGEPRRTWAEEQAMTRAERDAEWAAFLAWRKGVK